MSEPMILGENLGKRYLLGSFGATSLRDEIESLTGRIFRRNAVDAKPRYRKNQEFWALQGVSFEIEKGDTVGLIGRNGAGKSTLLKLLSRITTPTTGRFVMNGKSASLLEVGTGFHSDLTGIENVFLNGAILGMRRWEIKSKLDDILEFSGVSKFADTPVKRYSSGMRVRLAFAVAAHLRQDILIVDEVLAVGDHEFQRKCLGKMGEVSREGRTVVFVSHNMYSISRLCRRCMYLKDGRLESMGDTADVIASYLGDIKGKGGSVEWPEGITNPGEHAFRLFSVRFLDIHGNVTNHFSVLDPVKIVMEFGILEPMRDFGFVVTLRSGDGITITECSSYSQGNRTKVWEKGRYVYEATLPGKRINAGTFTLSVFAVIFGFKYLLQLDDLLDFSLERLARDGVDETMIQGGGIVFPEIHWNLLDMEETR